MLRSKDIYELRSTLREELEAYSGKDYIILNLDDEILKDILLKDGKFEIDFELVKKLNLRNFDFTDVDVSGLDFTRSCGVKINPQTVKDKNMESCILRGVTLTGNFNGVSISGTDFKSSFNAIINPQKVKNKDLHLCKLNDAIITGSFDDVLIVGTDFTGSEGAKINPNTVAYNNMSCAKLCDARLIDAVRKVYIAGTDFSGCKGGACIFVDRAINRDFRHTVFNGATIYGSFNDSLVEYANFTHSKDAVINAQKLRDKSLEGTKLTDATIQDDLGGINTKYTMFHGCHGIKSFETSDEAKEIEKTIKKCFKK